MTRIYSLALVVATSLALLSCDNSKDESSDLEERIKELEASKQKDSDRQRELEQELASHKLAQEWAAIERERMQIETRRAELEGSDSDELQALDGRDEKLAGREALAQEQHSKLVTELQRNPSITKLPANAEFPMAGREAGEFADISISTTTVDYQYFNDALAPYGTWYDTEEYGSVWQPAVCREPDWRPYTRGQWSCSDRGWTWVSSEPFGWATYHYGRWARLQNRGWIWVPGTQWAPNWCTWRSSDTFIGWAPLPPETLAYQNCEWDARVEKQYGIASSCFNFVRALNFDRSISRHCLPLILNEDCLAKTNNITKIKLHKGLVFCGGPGYHKLSELLGRRLPFYEIHRHNRSYAHHNPASLRSRIQGNRLIVAAPTVQKSRSHRSSKHLTKVVVERSKSTDPQVLATYRQMRQREAPPVTHTKTTQKATPSPQPAMTSKAVKPIAARISTTTRPSTPKPKVSPSPIARRANDKKQAEARLQAFREMARKQRAIASAERARREEQQAAERKQQEDLAQQQRIAQIAKETERQKIAAQQTQRDELQQRQNEETQRRQREETQRRSQEEAQRKQRDEQQRMAQQRQQQQEDARRRQQAEEQQRQQAESQRRAREEAQRRQRQEQDRQRAAEQRRQQEQAQRQQREEQQRRSQEQAQRQQREEQQRQRPARSR